MSLQTNVFRNGQWVTETISVDAVIKKTSTKSKAKKGEAPAVPSCGILTRTLVETPIFHWTLPVRLRAFRHNDVAFIGEHFIQVSELLPGGRLIDIARKNDFGSRIRNAKVIGSLPDKDDEVVVKMEDSVDVAMDGQSPWKKTENPQLLSIVLESGHLVFLSLSANDQGGWSFVTARIGSTVERLLRPGYHMAVDPSSNYVALGSNEGHLAIYEMRPELRYSAIGTESPVRSQCARKIEGVIHKMEFLYPPPEDDYYVILLLIVIRDGNSRLLTFEWEIGEDVKSILSQDKRGHRLPQMYQMPLLLIPLTVRTAFFAVCSNAVAVCKDMLSGPPVFEIFNVDDLLSSDSHSDNQEPHYGNHEPLWSAWTRPFRLSSWRVNKDAIYLAREDGRVLYLEIDSENILGTSGKVGTLKCHISTAFAAMDDQYTDALVVGGDQGQGAIWQIPARDDPFILRTLPNWSPAVDFTTTDAFQTWNQDIGSDDSRMVPWTERKETSFAIPDRLFGTSGRGTQGSVTEYRYGYRARIGRDIEFDLPSKQCWVFPTGLENRFDVLVALPSVSTGFQISDNEDHAVELDASNSKFDFTSRTLAAELIAGQVIQVTESSVTIISLFSSSNHLYRDIIQSEGPVTVEDAAICHDFIAVSTYADGGYHVHAFVRNGQALNLAKSWELDGQLTCLSIAKINGTSFVAVGTWYKDEPFLQFLSLGSYGLPERDEQFNLRDLGTTVEALTSLASFGGDGSRLSLVCGTKCGHVVVLGVEAGSSEPYSVRVEKIGVTATTIYSTFSPSGDPIIVACCDSGLVLMTDLTTEKQAYFRKIHRVILAKEDEPNLVLPHAHSISFFNTSVIGEIGCLTLFLLVQGHVLVVDVSLVPGAVNRQIPVDGTPHRVLYSHKLDCLVVAVQHGPKQQSHRPRPTIRFLDVNTGEDLSKPSDSSGADVDFITGLGSLDDRIYCLYEWLFRREGKTWQFFVVGTRDKLIIVSTERVVANGNRKIRFWTRHKQKNFESPVFSVVAESNGIIFCVGTYIHWATLDVLEKKLKVLKSIELDSPAISLRLANGKLLALTARHSLEVIDYRGSGPSTLPMLHCDKSARDSTHMIEMGDMGDVQAKSSITLVADIYCSAVGMSIPWHNTGKEFDQVFEAADLPASIRKFRRGRTRPPWSDRNHRPRFGVRASTIDGADVFAVSLDGSLLHVALIEVPLWRVLKFLQVMTLRSEEFCPLALLDGDFPISDSSESVDQPPANLHIDGDLLRRCYDERALERIIAPDQLDTFVSRMRGIDEVKQRIGPDEDTEYKVYFELAYEILEYLMASPF